MLYIVKLLYCHVGINLKKQNGVIACLTDVGQMSCERPRMKANLQIKIIYMELHYHKVIETMRWPEFISQCARAATHAFNAVKTNYCNSLQQEMSEVDKMSLADKESGCDFQRVIN